MNMDFYNPVRIHSGKDCFKDFRDYSTYGAKCVIVCGKNSARKSGALADAENGLRACGVEYAVFDEIEPNPLLSTTFEIGAKAREFGADFILGIGGGSPLDAAKAVAVFAANPTYGEQDIFSLPRKAALPLLAVNTTAGTGSEVTPYSVLTDPSAENKRSFAGDDIYPKVAFLDAAYTEKLPLLQTMATGADALCHAIEGRFMKKANLISDAYGDMCIPMLCEGLRRAAKGDLSLEVREMLLYGSSMAGLVISRTGTGFVHSTGYMLTYHHDVPHGQANAYFIADFIMFMGKTHPCRSERIYDLCGVSDGEELFAFLSNLNGMPLDLKLDDSTLSEYADFTIGARNVTNALSAISRDELFDILKKRLG